MTQILIVEDQDDMRAGIRAMLRPPVIDKELRWRFDALTPRERDVTVLIASGLGNHEIAAQLSVSPFTVKTHAVRAMTKVGARDRAQLVSFTFQAGLCP